MNIFITGATGFIGKNIVKELGNNHNLILYSRKKISKENQIFFKDYKVKILIGDITKINTEKIIVDIDYIIHLASVLGKDSLKEKDYFKVNVLGTKNIIKLAKKKKVKKIIYLSSVAADYKKYNKKDPSYLYGKSKFLAEDLLKNSNLKYTIIRPSLVFGPFDKKTKPFFWFVKKKMIPIIGNGKNIIQPLYVGSLCKLIIKSLHKNFSKKVIITGETLSIEEFILKIAEEYNINLKIIKIPKKIAWIFSKIKNPIFTRSKYYILTSSFVYNPTTKIEKKTSEGIKKTIKWLDKDNVFFKDKHSV